MHRSEVLDRFVTFRLLFSGVTLTSGVNMSLPNNTPEGAMLATAPVPRVLGLTATVKDFMGWDLAVNFPERIRDLRDALGMTQAELANLFGVSSGQVSSWERGKQKPHMKNLRRIAAQHDWPLEIFMEDGPMPVSAVSLTPTSTLEAKQVKVARILRTISKASGALSDASRLLANGATEDAEGVLKRVVRVEDYENGGA